MRRFAPFALLAACGSGGGMMGDDAPEIDAAVDAPPGENWMTLVERSWTLAAMDEAYLCRRVQVESDLFISGFSVISPPGTHHTILTLSPSGTAEGDYACSPQNTEPAMLYGGGVATNDVLFPDGVAIKVTAGQYINLNLHLYNAGDVTVTRTSGVRVRLVEESAVVTEADMMFAGTTDITIPGNNVPVTATGICTAPTQWKVFTLWPHMHAYATRQQIVVRRVGGAVESLLDTAYDFEDQRNYPMAEKQIDMNDEIEVRCTYQNDTGVEVTYGDSASDEMCLAGMYKYPKGGQSSASGCVQEP